MKNPQYIYSRCLRTANLRLIRKAAEAHGCVIHPIRSVLQVGCEYGDQQSLEDAKIKLRAAMDSLTGQGLVKEI